MDLQQTISITFNVTEVTYMLGFYRKMIRKISDSEERDQIERLYNKINDLVIRSRYEDLNKAPY